MSLASNIARRSGSAAYYARLTVPPDLQAEFGRRELWKSLKTKDAREAKERVLEVLAGWKADFREMRRRREAVPATPEAIQAATWEHYQGEVEHHQADRRMLPTGDEIAQAEIDARARLAAGEAQGDPLRAFTIAVDALVLRDQAKVGWENRKVRKATVEKHLADGETALVEGWACDLIRRENWSIEPGTPTFRDLCQRLQRAELEALRRAEEHDRGDYTGRPADPAVQAPISKPAAPVAAPGESILDLLGAYEADNRKRLTADTLRVNKQIIGMFADFVGHTLPVSAISKRRHVFPWKEALRRYPVRAAEIGVFQGMSFRKIIAENERVGRPVLSDKTVNRYLSALGGFCTWAEGNGMLDDNPVQGVLIAKDRGPSKVRSYSTDQLSAVFRSPVFTGCLANGREHKPGDLRPGDHRRWLPLLALFTGARMQELAQLLVGDIREERGRWIIHVTTEGDANKTTKTKGSQRVIPLHPELERLGFLAFHVRQSQTGDKRLFPEIEPDARGQLTGNVSRWWNRYVARVGVKNDASVNFHSFRHGFMDALRRAGFLDEQFGFLVGHAKATTTGRYGILSEGDLDRACKMIDAVAYPGLDLSDLY